MPIEGARCQNDQFGRLETAQLAVEVAQSGRHAGDPAVLLEGGFGPVDRVAESGGERGKIAPRLADGREIVEVLLGLFDLGRGVEIEIDIVGFVDDVGTDLDQRPAQMPVEDGSPVIAGVDDRDDGGGEAGQVIRAADLVQGTVALEQVLERDRIGDLAHIDQLADGAEDAAVARIGEMLGLEEIGNPVEGPVVGEQGAEQRHLRLVVVRRHTEGGAFVQTVGKRTACVGTASLNRTRTLHKVRLSICTPPKEGPYSNAKEKTGESNREPIDPKQSYAQIVESVEKSRNGPKQSFGRFRKSALISMRCT